MTIPRMPAHLVLALFSVLFTAGITLAAEEGTPTEIEYDRSEGGTLYFKLPPGSKALASVKADIYDVKLLGQLRPEEAALPYFILAGRPCQDCIEDIKIHLLRPSLQKPLTVVYPGKILDSKTRQLLLESRAFFGQCLPRRGPIYVVFQSERVDRRHSMQKSVFVAEPGKDRIEEKLIEKGLPSVNETLRFVKKKSCREISGRNRAILRKPFQFKKAVKQTEDEEDDDEGAPKENESDRDAG